MITVRPSEHSLTGRPIVEILENNEVVGIIYPTESGIKIVSAHISTQEIDDDFNGEVIKDDGSGSFPPIPAVIIEFQPSPYIITPDGIIRI